MPAKKYHVKLEADEREQLLEMTRKGEIGARKMKRAQILLKADEGWKDADIIKAYFSLMDPAGMGLFIMGNLADYIFILFYGIFFYSTARLISWNYKGGLTKSVGMSLAWVGVIAAVLDGIENLFLFAMTANPAGFPSWLALAHSTFATAKFLFLYAAMGWTVAGFVLNRTPLSGILISGLKAR